MYPESRKYILEHTNNEGFELYEYDFNGFEKGRISSI